MRVGAVADPDPTADPRPAATRAACCGPLLGALLAHLTLGPLELRLLTGQAADPAAVLPWWLLGLVGVALLATAAVVVPVESALRRRDRLSEVLRVGGITTLGEGDVGRR